MDVDANYEYFISKILKGIGEDPLRSGLHATPERVVKSWDQLYCGYTQDPAKIFTVFEDMCDQMVVLRDIEFYSTCEHHMLPFFGKAHIAYLPKDKVVGISKLARLLEIYARRLQIQERIGQQVSSAIMKYLKPQGCGVVLEAQHLCMTARGVGKQNSVMVTSSLEGSFLTDGQVRDEFLRIARR